MMALVSEKEKTKVYRPIELDFNLYLVTDRRQVGDKSLLKAVEEALKGGVRAVQLREKDLRTRELLKLAYEMRELTLHFDSRLFINDRVDIAIAVDADGVHLGQKSIPPYAVRRFAAGLIIGVSTHSVEEALRAERDGADFITVGPVYHTPSKAGMGEPLGLESLRRMVGEVSVPVFAIGGVKCENIREVMGTGAAGVAMISGILATKDIKAATLKCFREMR